MSTATVPTCPLPGSQTTGQSSASVTLMQAYCAGRAPNDDEQNRLLAAIDSIRMRGGPCAAIANLAQDIVTNQDGFHFFPTCDGTGNSFANFKGGSAAPPGQDWLIISDELAKPGAHSGRFDTTQNNRIPNYQGPRSTSTFSTGSRTRSTI